MLTGLIEGGLTIVKRVQAGGLAEVRNLLAELQFRISPARRAQTLEALASALKAGKPIDTAVRVFQRQNEKTGMPIAGMYRQWSNRMANTMPFHEAVAPWFSEAEVMLIATGSRKSLLETALREAAFVAKASAEIRSVVIAESAQPLAYFGMLIYVAVSFATGQGAELVKTVPPEALDDKQALVFAICKVIAATWMPALACLGGVVAWAIWSLPRLTGQVREKVLDRLPPWSMYKSLTGASFMIAMPAMIRSGRSMDDALHAVHDHSGPWMRQYVGRMLRQMQNAADPSEQLDVGLLEQEVVNLMAVHAVSGSLDAAMEQLGKDSVKIAMASVASKARIARTLVLAGVAFVVFHAFDTVMSMSDAQERAQKMQSGTRISAPMR